MNYILLIYILFAIGFGFGGLMYFFKKGQYVGAVSYLVGAILVFVFFGMRWFAAKTSSGGSSWPPVMNTCPDYLTYYERKSKDITGKVSKQPTCIDTIGISTQPAKLKKWPGKQPESDSDDYYFSLDFKSKDDESLLAEKCERALEYGVTWEGICDGETCSRFNPPVEPGGGGNGGGTNGSTCPPPSRG